MFRCLGRQGGSFVARTRFAVKGGYSGNGAHRYNLPTPDWPDSREIQQPTLNALFVPPFKFCRAVDPFPCFNPNCPVSFPLSQPSHPGALLTCREVSRTPGHVTFFLSSPASQLYETVADMSLNFSNAYMIKFLASISEYVSRLLILRSSSKQSHRFNHSVSHSL